MLNIYSKYKGFLFIVLALLISFNRFSFSQLNTGGIFSVDGLVFGYNHDPSKYFLQKEKQIILEGILEKVSITVFDNGKPIYTTQTNNKGEFQLRMKTGKIYKIELSKKGYTKSLLLIDLKSVPTEIAAHGIRFTGMELILNSFQPKDTSQTNFPFGRLYYNARTKFFDFQAGEVKSKKGILARHESANTPVDLMKRAILKNRNSINKRKNIRKNFNEDIPLSADTVINVGSKFKLTPWSGIENFTEGDLNTRESEIQKAKKQLEQDKLNALTSEDSLIIKERENLLNMAVLELASAKKVIGLQENTIFIQKKLLYLAIFSLVLLCGFLFIVYKSYKEKKQTNILLKEKNKKITDSINYARRIQNSVLLEESKIQKLLPDSFIYHQPRDIVSGDFYWFSEFDGKIIVTAVDCTGHGVPGAFMSLVGNILLNEIVNEKHVIEPSSILNLLHTGVSKAVHRNTGETHQDGMEMSLCVIDHKKNTIEYAGAMNPIYVVENNSVTIINGDIQVIGRATHPAGKNNKIEFTTRLIPIHKNMSVYLFTDGYMDQFGGPENKKFNTARFKQLLLDIQKLEMNLQKLEIEKTLKIWKGDSRQIDDVLVMGIKF